LTLRLLLFSQFQIWQIFAHYRSRSIRRSWRRLLEYRARNAELKRLALTLPGFTRKAQQLLHLHLIFPLEYRALGWLAERARGVTFPVEQLKMWGTRSGRNTWLHDATAQSVIRVCTRGLEKLDLHLLNLDGCDFEGDNLKGSSIALPARSQLTSWQI